MTKPGPTAMPISPCSSRRHSQQQLKFQQKLQPGEPQAILRLIPYLR